MAAIGIVNASSLEFAGPFLWKLRGRLTRLQWHRSLGMAQSKDAPHQTGKATKQKFPHEQSRDQVNSELGETSDQYGPEGRNTAREMPEGDEIARSNPDVTQIGPPGGGDIDEGFRDRRERRDRPR